MEYYDATPGDEASGGGAFIDEQGYGYEVFNFKAVNRSYYGYVEVAGGIALERLGAEPGAKSVSNVTAVFVAPREGRIPYVICGWYRNATVYRFPQEPPPGLKRVFRNVSIEYNLQAAQEMSVRIDPVDDRVFQVPRGRGGIGQSRIWYADQPEQLHFLKGVRRYIQTRELPKQPTTQRKAHVAGWQPDVERRQLIERRAVRTVWEHFEARRYQLKSVEALNLGWDLEATNSGTTLCLEVKGTSGSEVSCEVTPNEYEPIRRQRLDYRLCVVTDALARHPGVNIFRWSQERQAWCSGDDQLRIKELTGARLSI
jgi:hypothetical protein